MALAIPAVGHLDERHNPVHTVLDTNRYGLDLVKTHLHCRRGLF